MSVKESKLESKYSEPLQCRTCEYALKPIGEFERAEAAFCDKYDSVGNMKPYGVLFCNKECEFYVSSKS